MSRKRAIILLANIIMLGMIGFACFWLYLEAQLLLSIEEDTALWVAQGLWLYVPAICVGVLIWGISQLNYLLNKIL